MLSDSGTIASGPGAYATRNAPARRNADRNSWHGTTVAKVGYRSIDVEKRLEELENREPDLCRRRVMLASLSLPFMPALAGCMTPMPLRVAGTTREAHQLLMDSAAAHGLEAFQELSDLSVSYEGKWNRLAGKLQPVLVAGQRDFER